MFFVLCCVLCCVLCFVLCVLCLCLCMFLNGDVGRAEATLRSSKIRSKSLRCLSSPEKKTSFSCCVQMLAVGGADLATGTTAAGCCLGAFAEAALPAEDAAARFDPVLLLLVDAWCPLSVCWPGRDAP